MLAKSRLHGAPPLADLDLPLPRHLALGPGVGGVRERGPRSALLQSVITLHPTHARVSPTWRATHLSAKDEEPVLEKVALDEPDDLLADLLAQVHALHHRPEGPEVRQTRYPVAHPTSREIEAPPPYRPRPVHSSCSLAGRGVRRHVHHFWWRYWSRDFQRILCFVPQTRQNSKKEKKLSRSIGEGRGGGRAPCRRPRRGCRPPWR